MDKRLHNISKTTLAKIFPLWRNSTLKIELFVIFGTSCFQNKNSWHLRFSITQIFQLTFTISEIWHGTVSFCWNYGPLNLLYRFTGYSRQQLNIRQMKTGVNLVIHLFESSYQKEYLVKVSSFLTHWPLNDHPLLKLLQNGMERTFYWQFLTSIGNMRVAF